MESGAAEIVNEIVLMSTQQVPWKRLEVIVVVEWRSVAKESWQRAVLRGRDGGKVSGDGVWEAQGYLARFQEEVCRGRDAAESVQQLLA